MQTLKERAVSLKKKIQKMTKTTAESDVICSKEGEATNPLSQRTRPVNWSKGWGKYGKT